ncbi:hypothetical protein [Acetobacter orleanensis]|uniref:Uncharacterized protein n=1 Tax=Acetobacter orleanensis TaxID=104099 RepID=A0A4Y3TPT1_9PROT|nr:hypothetical protein [Acetobacter orleanensis]KXV62573.1 hypothetical protein AD949_10725 [Acetobacter orleanensis]PCD79981.1 hypothetical protein CO710_03745 [Acetobacter orleanensis]GAN68292.1 hypothetical protein Abol_015_131 [Acetobacter orleanensis JCM 7639]GBR31110.1 hypothetical protein AA0473_2449 [Acetobacter orleanensis NRIC 0473]GEB82815.1 hypothetical protein AOR01nite_12920 [Acetobacter orleanensis]
MTPYLWWGLTIVVIVSLIALITFAFRAGDNAQNVHSSELAAEDAEVVAGVQANMAKAQAEGPQDKDQLLQRLDAGTG